MKINSRLIISAMVLTLTFAAGFFMGRALDPFNLAINAANSYVARQDISDKEKALDIIKKQKDFLEIAVRNVRLAEMRKSIGYSLADKLMEHQMWKEALPYLQEVNSIVPGHLQINYKLGLCYYSLSRLEPSLQARDSLTASAVRYLSVTLMQQENHADANYLMGRIRLDQSSYSESLRYFSKVLDRFPNDEDTLFAVGQIYFRTGEYEKARKVYEKLLTVLPKNSGKQDTVMKNLETISRAMEGELSR